MTRRRQPARPATRQAESLDEHWQVFIGFWLLAGVTLLIIGIAMFATVQHSHRVAAILIFLGIISIVIGLVVRRAAHGAAD
jgi:uncharacterized membrane protein